MTARHEAHDLLVALMLGVAFFGLCVVFWSWNMR